ncbi:hypothetical protein TWF679_008786 [Orbilia oligospora]|uniref:Uncharacterized protein n=1 Tax=Orbilia oligospora TaxID=2813651 RepID=A0A8H8V3Y7_ORBOL|nr:hypothetical protein TWF679_008786 [Orbilia oligospora]
MHLTSTLLFLYIGGISAQESSGSSTTTVFETVHNTYTITRKIDCEDLKLCENLAWNLRPGSPSPGNNGTDGPSSVIPSPFDPDFASTTTPSSTESDGSSATGEPFEFLLRGDGVLSEHFIAFDENKATVLVQSGKEPQYLQISAAGELGTVNTTETTEVVFLRITNDTLPLARRQDDPNTEVYEIGDLLHAAPSEILSSDKLSTFYFSGTVLKLDWKGLIYTFYAVPRDVVGEYSLKMARLGTVVPASFIPLNLNYLRQPSSSTTSITFPTTGTQAGALSSTTSTTSRRSRSRSTGGSDSSSSSFSGSGNESTSSNTGTSTSDTATSASPTSVDPASVTLVYDIITSFSYQSFCSEYLEYTGTVSRVSTEESSIPTGTLVTTSTEIFEKFVYTSTETTYTATTTVTTDATAMERRELISPAPENEPRAAQAQVPFLLATFNAAEISLGCSSAVPAPETSTEHSTTTRTVSYESIDLRLETSTTEISTASLLTAAGPLEIPVPANGYWWVADDTIKEFYHQHLTVIHDDTGISYEELTQATASTVWFNLQWNETAQAYNPYWKYVYTPTGASTTVTEIRWLWYYVERGTMNLMLPQLLTEEAAAAKTHELRKALFTVDNKGFLKTVGEPVIYICQWRGSNLAFGYSIYTFWGPRTGFLDLLKAALLLRGDTATEPFGCENVSDALQVIAFAGDSLGKK